MAKKRVYEIARAEGLPSALVLQRLQRAGLTVKTASSTVEEAEAMHVLQPKRYPKPDSMKGGAEAKKAPARPKKKRPAPPKKQDDEPPAEEAPAPDAEAAPRRPRPRRPTMRRRPSPRRPAAEEASPVESAPSETPTEAETPPAPPPAPVPVAETPAPPPPAPEPERPRREPKRSVAAEARAAVPPAPPEAREIKKAPDRPAAPPEPEPEPVAEPPAPAAEPAPPRSRKKSEGGGKRRRVVIDAGASRRGPAQPTRDRGPARGEKPAPKREPEPAAPPVDATPVDVQSGATVKDLADNLNVSTSEIIKVMMGMGEMATITQSLSDEAIELVAVELGRTVKIVRAEDEVVEEEFVDPPGSLVERAPVVTIMGHVDHGKTSLLDAIRSSEIAESEAGGITQHIGAYQITHDDRDITFLDTPGHEAFTAMRARGARVTDVALIVVAADDGVMPQTIEAIDHARAAEVPFMVVVNKVDKEDANPDRVKQELGNHEVVPSDWGGSHEFVEVSAKEGTGLDSLLETILLVADADAEPKANPEAEASGTVIESRLDPGRGPVSTLLIQRGRLSVGDVVLAGEEWGKVRAMLDHTGADLEVAGPSVPVEILGLSGVADAGEKFRVVPTEREARQRAGQLSQRLRAERLANVRPVSLDDIFAQIKEGELKELNIIIKGDVQGSVEALVESLAKIDTSEVRLGVIHTGVGAVNESDVMLAAASRAIIIAFNVRPRADARLLAEREGVDVRTYRVIYRAIEDVENALIGMLDPDVVEDAVGEVEVRETFRSSRLGTIAGCYVTQGMIARDARVRVLRDGAIIHEGEIASLRRFDDDVREVAEGFECGLIVADFNDVKEGDAIEVYELREVARTSTRSEA